MTKSECNIVVFCDYKHGCSRLKILLIGLKKSQNKSTELKILGTVDN